MIKMAEGWVVEQRKKQKKWEPLTDISSRSRHGNGTLLIMAILRPIF